jgi:hypothetical protein
MDIPRNECNPLKERSKLVFPAGRVKPLDFLRFIQLGSFASDWRRLGLDDDAQRALEVLIMIHPTKAPVVPGTGRLRKIRFGGSERGGKSFGIRVGYVYFPAACVVTLLVAYGKDEQGDLTTQQKRAIRDLIQEIARTLDQGA